MKAIALALIHTLGTARRRTGGARESRPRARFSKRAGSLRP
jgi:hypothetical protein